MLALSFLALLGVALSQTTTCKQQSSNPPTWSSPKTITVGTTTRRYNMYVPAGVTYPTSVIFAWHGITSCPSTIEGKMKLIAQANTNKFIVIYPVTSQVNSGATCRSFSAAFSGAGCCTSAPTKDVELFTAIKNSFVADGCVNASCVFSVGFSNGGFMTHRIGCEVGQSSNVAAVALHSGGYGSYDGVLPNSPWALGKCKTSFANTKVIPYIGFHGDRDTTVPFRGGKNPVGTSFWGSFYDLNAIWANQNGCGAATSVTKTVGTQRTNYTNYLGCGNENYQLVGFAHDWWNQATALTVAFFKKYGL